MADISYTTRVTGFSRLFRSVKVTQEGANPLRNFRSTLGGAIPGVTSLIAQKLSDALDQAMEAAVWRWENGTRDIVDTSRLRSSKSITASGDGIDVVYNAPYASLIHYGGYILPYGNQSAEKVYIPPRPWVQSVISGGGPVPQFDFAAVMREALRRVLG